MGIGSKFLIIGSALVLAAPPVAAQFGGISIPRIPSGSDSASKGSTDTGCKSPKKKKGAAIFGDIVGRVAGDQISRTGAGRFLPVSEFSSTITEAIACRLDPEEQAQAAQATDEALRTGEVGETAEWTSGTRENVTGKSTVKAQASGWRRGEVHDGLRRHHRRWRGNPRRKADVPRAGPVALCPHRVTCDEAGRARSCRWRR